MSIAKKSIIYTLGRVIPQALGFFLLPIYTDVLSSEEYGIVESMYTLTMVLTIFFSMATERSMFRLYYDYDTEYQKKQFVGNVTISIIVFSVIVLGALFLFDNQVSLIFRNIPFEPYFRYSIFTAFFMAFAFVPQTLYQVEERAVSFLIISISAFLVNIGFILFYLLIADEGAIGLIKGRYYGSLAMLPIYLFIVYRASIFNINIKVLKNIFSFSLPMVPTLLSAWILNMSNRIFIEQYFSLAEVGVFSLAFKISSIATVLFSGIFTAFNPTFYRLANNNDQTQSRKTLKKLTTILCFFVCIICFVTTFLAKELIPIFFNSDYLRTIEVFPILMLSIFFIQISGIYNLMIYQYKKPQWIMIISILGALSSIGFNFLLVPKFGMIGAAIASVFSAALLLGLKFVYAKKSYFIPLPLKLIFMLSSILSILIIIDISLSFDIYISLITKTIALLITAYFLYLKYKDTIKLLFK